MTTPHRLPPAIAALPVPTQEAALEMALHELAHGLRTNEQVWLAEKHYDDSHTTWRISMLRRGPQTLWVLQRYRYDGQAATLYYIGERTLTSKEAAELRRNAEPFDITAWQNHD